MTITTPTAATGRIRWLIRRDTPEVLAIDTARYPDGPLTDDSLVAMLRDRATIGMVYDEGNRVQGFMVYRLDARRICILRMAVAPEAQRKNVAAAMLDKLKSKLVDRRRVLICDVPETDLDRQIYLRWAGFRCRQVVGDVYRFSFLSLEPQ